MQKTYKQFEEKLTPHLKELAKHSKAIEEMYIAKDEAKIIDTNVDLLNEKVAPPVFGTVQKYPGQILILLSLLCAANCRYCERQDRVGDGKLSKEQIDEIIRYLQKNKNIHEVIASGGDPLMNPSGLKYLFSELEKIEHIKVLRIHTRFPLQSPKQVNMELMKELVNRKETVYLILHIDHPDELVPETIELIKEFRKMGYLLLTQSVFLKGVNNNVKVLKELFLKLYRLGVKPYYIYNCQDIQTTKKFIIPIEEEIQIMTQLRHEIPGIAFPQHVIDVPGGFGKVPFPSAHWKAELAILEDYKGDKFYTESWEKLE